MDEKTFDSPVVKQGRSVTTVAKVGTGNENAMSGKQKKVRLAGQMERRNLPFWWKMHLVLPETIG